MRFFFNLSFYLLILCDTVIAQDTIKIQREVNYDKNCFLEVCINKKCFTDTISQKLFFERNNIELKMNEDCTTKNKFDVFVASFELSVQNNEGNYSSITAQSSFFTYPQKRMIQKMKPNNVLLIKNIAVHAPDGFKKMDDLRIVIN